MSYKQNKAIDTLEIEWKEISVVKAPSGDNSRNFGSWIVNSTNRVISPCFLCQIICSLVINIFIHKIPLKSVLFNALSYIS